MTASDTLEFMHVLFHLLLFPSQVSSTVYILRGPSTTCKLILS